MHNKMGLFSTQNYPPNVDKLNGLPVFMLSKIPPEKNIGKKYEICLLIS